MEFERARYHIDRRNKLHSFLTTEAKHRKLPSQGTGMGAASIYESSQIITMDTIKTGMRNRSVRWGEIPSPLLNEILKRAAGEIVIDGKPLPPALLEAKDLTQRNFKFLGERKLNSLYYHNRNEEERKQEAGEEKRDIMSVILDKAGIHAKVEDVRTSFKIGRRITWERVPPTTIRGLLEKVAEENEIPASLISEKEIKAPSPFLHGNNLDRLYQHVIKQTRKDGERDEQAMTQLLNIAGLQISYEDILYAVNHNKMIRWERVSQRGLRTLLSNASIAIGRPVFLWRPEDFNQKLEILNNTSLGGLYHNLNQYKDEQQTAVAYLQEYAAMPATVDNILWAMSLREPFWGKVPNATKKILLEKAASELDLPAIMLTYSDLANRFAFLEGNDLVGLYQNYEKKSDAKDPKKITSDILNNAQVDVSIDEVVIAMNNNAIVWERVPITTLKDIFEKTAEELEIPVCALSTLDMRIALAFLENHTLKGMLMHYTKTQKNTDEDKSVVESLLDKMNLYHTLDSVIETVIVGRHIVWRRVPDSVFNQLIKEVASEVELPPAFVLPDQLSKTHFKFLYGNSLERLYKYAFLQKREENETAMMWLRKKAGITEPPPGRRNTFRLEELQQLFLSHIPLGNVYDLLDQFVHNTDEERINPFMPWIESVTNLYKRFFFSIPKTEIIDQIVVSMSEELIEKDKPKVREFLYGIHIRVENYISTVMSTYLREKSIEAIIGDTNLTIKDRIESLPQSSPGGVVYSAKMETALSRLSHLERFIVESITVDQWSLAGISDAINRKKGEFHLTSDIDVDKIVEISQDALENLRLNLQE